MLGELMRALKEQSAVDRVQAGGWLRVLGNSDEEDGVLGEVEG